jgi:transcriptional regulator with XRE-family HTH domain
MMLRRQDGPWLRRQRDLLALTQAELAEVLEVAPNSIARMERGELPLRRVTRLAIQALLAQPFDLERLRPRLTKALRLRPLPIRLGDAGELLPPIDDDWMLERVEADPPRIHIENLATGHVIDLQPPHIREFFPPDVLLLRVRPEIMGRKIKLEPVV